MLKRSLTIAAAVLFLTQTACLTFTTKIKIRPDGSGQIEQTMLMNTKALTQMAAEMGGEVPEGGPPEPTEEEKKQQIEELKSQASQLGEGVTFVNAEFISNEDSQGFVSVYEFDDINKLQKVSQLPTGQMGAPPPGEDAEETGVAFTFEKKGGKSILTAMMPPDKEEEAAEAAEAPPAEAGEMAEEMADQMMEQMKSMFDGLKLGVYIEVEGSIVKTNGPHTEGNVVTVMEMDFGKLMENEEALKKMAEQGPGGSILDAQEMLNGVEGIKIPTDEKVFVEFK